MYNKDIPANHIRDHYSIYDYLAAVLIQRGKDGQASSVKHEYGTAEALASEKRQAHFRAANANGADIYLTVNALVPGTHNREKRDVQEIRHLYLDVDRNGGEVLARILSSPLPKPSTVIQTSPGKLQMLWRVAGFSKDEAEIAVRGMAAEYGADAAVWDCARILRIPGFRNTKYAEPFYAAIVPGNRSTGILTPDQFPKYPALQQAIAQAYKIAPGHHSMSEREYGQTLRKLEHGESPQAVQSWLAHEAAQRGKPRPDDYARRTIESALRRHQHRPCGHSLSHSRL